MKRTSDKSEDRHNTKRIARILAIIVSALFAAFAIAGFQHTGDYLQLSVFLIASAIIYMVIIFAFKGVDRLLDSVDDRDHSAK